MFSNTVSNTLFLAAEGRAQERRVKRARIVQPRTHKHTRPKAKLPGARLGAAAPFTPKGQARRELGPSAEQKTKHTGASNEKLLLRSCRLPLKASGGPKIQWGKAGGHPTTGSVRTMPFISLIPYLLPALALTFREQAWYRPVHSEESPIIVSGAHSQERVDRTSVCSLKGLGQW